MLLSIEHVTRYRYAPEAGMVALRLKIFPTDNAAQKTLSWQVTVNGDPVKPMLVDGQGDQIGLWHNHGPTEEVEIRAAGELDTTDMAGVLQDLPQSARPGIFLRKTDLTKPDDTILELANEAHGDTPLERMHDLSRLVADAITYRKGATDAGTSAAEAMSRGAGVCQDQAHVFITAARSLRIPARYVVGYLYDPDAGEVEETHAWPEAFIDGLGWTGFDVTHALCPTDAYVRICCGLDASDASPVRGTVSGALEEELDIHVRVASGQAQSQSQQ